MQEGDEVLRLAPGDARVLQVDLHVSGIMYSILLILLMSGSQYGSYETPASRINVIN